MTDDWVAANFSDETERTNEHKAVLGLSDELVEELFAADTLVIGTPIYNFTIPAALKAWIDMIARVPQDISIYSQWARRIIERQESLYRHRLWAGTTVGSDIDFASGYLMHILGFIGIHDVAIVAADQQMMKGRSGGYQRHVAS